MYYTKTKIGGLVGVEGAGALRPAPQTKNAWRTKGVPYI